MIFFQFFCLNLIYFCQSQITLCPTNMVICLNGGTCVIANQKDMTCICRTGYTGVFCENTSITTTTMTTTTTTSSVSLCPSSIQNICQNQGVCFIYNGREMFCKCSTGYAGTFNNEFNLYKLYFNI